MAVQIGEFQEIVIRARGYPSDNLKILKCIFLNENSYVLIQNGGHYHRPQYLI